MSLPIQNTMNTSDILFTPSITEESEVGKLDLHDDYKQIYIDIEWWIYAIMYITLPVFGGFGNILTFMVMQRGHVIRMHTSSAHVVCTCTLSAHAHVIRISSAALLMVSMDLNYLSTLTGSGY